MVMETGHDPAYCSLDYCQRCDDYGDGYSRGRTRPYGKRNCALCASPQMLGAGRSKRSR